MASHSKGIWKNETLRTIIVVILIVAIVFGAWYGSEAALGTKISPALAVVSGSMSIPYGAADYNFWLTMTTPFDRTLSVGDIIIIQGVNPKDLNVNYPNSDIIVFHDPEKPGELIVHRIIGVIDVNGTLYFQTKGDGNGNPWPQPPQEGFDPWDGNPPAGVPQNLVVGKVIMRIPLIGWIAIDLQKAGASDLVIIPIIIVIIIILIITEFVPPLMKRKVSSESNPQAESGGDKRSMSLYNSDFCLIFLL